MTSMNIIGVQASACVLFVNDPRAIKLIHGQRQIQGMKKKDDKTPGKGVHPRNHRMPYVAPVLFSG